MLLTSKPSLLDIDLNLLDFSIQCDIAEPLKYSLSMNIEDTYACIHSA